MTKEGLMFKVLTGTVEDFFPVDPDEHVKAWRWYWFTQGVTIDGYGNRRCNRTGEIVL